MWNVEKGTANTTSFYANSNISEAKPKPKPTTSTSHTVPLLPDPVATTVKTENPSKALKLRFLISPVDTEKWRGDQDLYLAPSSLRHGLHSARRRPLPFPASVRRHSPPLALSPAAFPCLLPGPQTLTSHSNENEIAFLFPSINLFLIILLRQCIIFYLI